MRTETEFLQSTWHSLGLTGSLMTTWNGTWNVGSPQLLVTLYVCKRWAKYATSIKSPQIRTIQIHNGSTEGVEMYLHHRGLNIQESSWMSKEEILLCVFCYSSVDLYWHLTAQALL